MVNQIAASQPLTTTAQTVPSPANPKQTQKGGFGFHDFLSAINPLQYVPVVGTIYRSATGDTIPDSTRRIGSMVFSFLTGGPIGAATTAAAEAVESATGFDPERIGHNLLAKLGIGHADPAPGDDQPSAVATTKPGASTSGTQIASVTPTKSPAIASAAQPIGARELAAHGVHKSADGTLTMGDISGADVLNTIELSQITATKNTDIQTASVQNQLFQTQTVQNQASQNQLMEKQAVLNAALQNQAELMKAYSKLRRPEAHDHQGHII